MKYYMDLEFNSPTNEIISIGCINEEGETFHTYVNPGKEINSYISRITGITNKVLKKAPPTEKAFILLYKYMRKLNTTDEFYFYSTSDKDVLHLLLYKIRNFNKKYGTTLLVGTHIIYHYRDASEDVMKHFKILQPVALKKVYDFYNQNTELQKHDALEDAIMLKDIINYMEVDKINHISRIKEFEEYKTNQNIPHKINRISKEGKVLETYDSINDASNWLIQNILKGSVRNIKDINKHNVNKKIKTAYNTNTPYVGYMWEQVE